MAEHVVTRSVRDSAAILDATAGPVPGDPYWAPPLRGPSFAAAAATPVAGLRVAVMTASPTGSAVDADCVAAVEATATLCESLGHRVEAAALSVDGDAFTAHFVNQWACANAWAIADWEHRVGRPVAEEDMEPLSWALIGLGRSIDGGTYLRSVQELQRISRDIADYFEGIDVLLTPTLAEPPAPLGTFDSPPGEPLTGLFRAATYVPFTPPFNVTGQPGISLPLQWNDAGLPIGVQFVGRFGDEETLLSLAGQLEEAAPVGRPPAAGRGVGGTPAVSSPAHNACPSRSWACTCCSGCRGRSVAASACMRFGRSGSRRRARAMATKAKPSASAVSMVAISVMPPRRMSGVESAARNCRGVGEEVGLLVGIRLQEAVADEAEAQPDRAPAGSPRTPAAARRPGRGTSDWPASCPR